MAVVTKGPVPGFVLTGFEEPCSDSGVSTGERLVALGWEINANQYRLMHLAAAFDDEREWWEVGSASPALWIARELDVEPSTAREWIRIGHALRYAPLIDAAFAAGELSYTKVRVLTRWADEENEAELLELALKRPASRLNAAIAKALGGEDDPGRDKRHHEARSFSYYTDGDGMVVGTFRLPPLIAKQIIALIEALVRMIARTPAGQPINPTSLVAQARAESTATSSKTTVAAGRFAKGASGANSSDRDRDGGGPADASAGGSDIAAPDAASQVAQPLSGASAGGSAVAVTAGSGGVSLQELRSGWQPTEDDDWVFPSMAQQRADALVAFFAGLDVAVETEMVVHVQGDGNSLDDGTPLTSNAVASLLPDSFIRLLIRNAEGLPINASSRQRYPTERQEAVVMARHNYECVDCGTTLMLQLDHNPAFDQTKHTIVDELEPRCAPCHKARHRHDPNQQPHRRAA